ncbi:acetate/propionate family kinase [Methylacidiphilum caldifontis]|uniref:Acetate kinase n=1 Tax=Methylacidiphilum caldifontis TaxID=2795386 RepID=A0A4Y8PEU3_9BACT|nr:acetate/propionate family kinase [Methylacidiphilum caldifontis]TFE70569.1 acetate kinase [Methylacidiphilum caldifontis]
MQQKNHSLILTINSGSTSLKVGLFDCENQTFILKGNIERIGLAQSFFRLRNQEDQTVIEECFQLKDHDEAIAKLFGFLRKNKFDENLLAVGHRIVHGGLLYSEPRLITSETVDNLKELVAFAPEHLPSQILAIESFRKQIPHVKNVGCFDTAFHRTIPFYARWYALPKPIRDMGIVRYGFHGLSCEYVMEELKKTEKEKALGKVIIAHLGGGASMTAVYNGQSIDTTMGFSPLSGLVMETRCGDLDPGAVLYLVKEKGLTASEVYNLLNSRSGLLGISGISSDMKELIEDTTKEAEQAIEVFVYQAKKHLGALVAILNGLDILVFTGGIGEHSALIRKRICENLDFLGIRLDPLRNESNKETISKENSPSKIKIIKANEELVIAQKTFKLISQGSLTL